MRKFIIILLVSFSLQSSFGEELKTKYVIISYKTLSPGSRGILQKLNCITKIIETKLKLEEIKKIPGANWAEPVFAKYIKNKHGGIVESITGKIFDDAKEARKYFRKEGKGKLTYTMTTEEFEREYKYYIENVLK